MIYFLIILLLIILLYLAVSYIAAHGAVYLNRQPVPKNPKDYGMDFESINLKPSDGINIKGWFIPAKSQKIIIMTHVGGLTKYGSTVTYSNPFKLYNKEIEFLKTAKHLHDAGYNVLMFDFRNHGASDKSLNHGATGVGLEEYKDVLAALDFIASRNDLKNMSVGFVSFCMGANSTIIAMSNAPEKFRNIKCFIAIQPISMEVFITVYSKSIFSPLGSKILMPMIRMFVKSMSGHKLSEMSPRNYVKNIKTPTLYVQAKNDPWTDLNDIKSFYENTNAPKEFYWIENTKHRFESYSYFQDNPEIMLKWLKKWM